MSITLLSPIHDEGVSRRANFFNGRLLTAEDLITEQNADFFLFQQTGQCLGEGVLRGLEVSLSPGSSVNGTPVVDITKGMAVNREGKIICLNEEVKVELTTGEKTTGTSQRSSKFTQCQPPSALLPNGRAVFILTIAPVCEKKYTGAAQVTGYSPLEEMKQCGKKYALDGVFFRLIEVDTASGSIFSGDTGQQIKEKFSAADSVFSTKENISIIRNLLAYLCLHSAEAGFPDLADDASSITGNTTTWGLLDALRPEAGTWQNMEEVKAKKCLFNNEVPLAMILWTKNGIEFIDPWSVRRRLHKRTLVTGPPFPMMDRQRAEREAFFMQFQGQLKEIKSQVAQNDFKLLDFFRFLPAAGIIPADVDAAKFLTGVTHRGKIHIDRAKVQPLFYLSYDYPPVDTNNLKEGELLWLYAQRDIQYTIFTSGHIPFQGDAFYNIARYNYSNYGSVIYNTL